MASEFLEILSPNALAELKQVEALVKTLASDIKSINNFKTSGTPSGADKNIKSLTDAYEKQAESIKKVSSGLKTVSLEERQALIDKKALTKELDLQAKAQSKLVGAYQNLVAKQQIAKRTLQDLVVAQGKNSVATKQAQLEYNKLTAKVNLANKATSNFSSSGLGKLATGFRNLLGAFGLYGGVMMFAEFAKSTINTIKELDKLDFTLKAVIRNEGELARTRAFLTEISLKYGLEIVNTTERYVKFMVAARQSGLELKKVERIFSTFAEAGAVLGLKTHELEGIFLALEQMLSKGKVTTEELRRQLGERLPGAMDLMAKALKVTTSELDKMLRAGTVLSSDAIPKLTETLREFYNLSGEGVDTLQASTQKLSTSWTLFIDTLNKSTGVGNLWKNILDSIADGIKGVSKAFGGNIIEAEIQAMASYSKELEDANYGSENYLTTIQKLRKEQDDLSKSHFDAKKQLKDLRVPVFGLIKDYEKEKEALEKTIGTTNGKYKAIESYIDLLKSQSKEEKRTLIETIISYKDKNDIIEDSLDLVLLEKMSVEQLQNAYTNLINGQKELGKHTIPYYQDLIKANEELRLKLKDNNKEDLEKAKILTSQNETYQKQIDLLEARNKASGGDNISRPKNQTITYSSGSQKAIDAQISKLKDLRDSVDQGTAKWATYDFTLQLLQATSKALNGDLDDTKETVGELTKELEKSTKKFKEFLEGVKDMQNEAKDSLKDFRDEFATEFFSDAGFEFTGNFLMNFDKITMMLEEGGDQWEDYFNLITEMGQEAFNFIAQASQRNFDAEYDRLEKQKEIALQFAGESDAAKERIEEQYEARRKVIQRREAKAQKAQAIVNTTINTAQAIMQIWAHSPDPSGISQGLLTAIIAGIGAAQVAVIASQKIPEFWKGTDNADSGLAFTQERGQEIITDKKGIVKDFGDGKGARLTMMDKGDKVYTAEQTKRIMFNNELNGILSNNGIEKAVNSINVVNNGLTKLDLDQVMSKHFSNIQVNQTVIDKNGLNTYVKKQNSKTTSLNNRVSFKGFSV